MTSETAMREEVRARYAEAAVSLSADCGCGCDCDCDCDCESIGCCNDFSVSEYRGGLNAAGLIGVELTHAVAEGMHGAIARARKPPAL